MDLAFAVSEPVIDLNQQADLSTQTSQSNKQKMDPEVEKMLRDHQRSQIQAITGALYQEGKYISNNNTTKPLFRNDERSMVSHIDKPNQQQHQ